MLPRGREGCPRRRRPRRGGSGVGTFQEEQSETVLESRGAGRGLQGRGSPAGPDALGSLANDTPPFRQQEGSRFSRSQLSLLESVSIDEARPDLEAPHWPWLSLRWTRALVTQPSPGPASYPDGASPVALTSRGLFSVTCSVLRRHRIGHTFQRVEGNR